MWRAEGGGLANFPKIFTRRLCVPHCGNKNAAKIGKNLGDDLAEGKPTLPLLIAMHRGTAAQAATVRHAIMHSGIDQMPAVLDAVNATAALDYVRNLAANEAKLGVDAIAHFPDSPSKQALIDLAAFSVARDF